MKPHFEQFLSYRRAAIKPSTAETYRNDQAQFFRWADSRGLTLQSITRADLAEWMAHAQTLGQSNGTIMSRLATLRAFFAWAEGESLRVGNPVDLQKLPRLKSPPADRRPFTEDEFRRLLRAAEGPFWAPAITIAWFSGLRMGDVAGLLWAEIDLSNRTITRRAMKTSSTHAPRTIPIDPELFETLLTLYNAPERAASLFVLPAMQSLYTQSRTMLCQAFKRLSERAGIQNGHMHRFRHSFVSRLLNAGVDPITIASMTGQSLPVLKRYAHISLDAKREALAKASSNQIHENLRIQNA